MTLQEELRAVVNTIRVKPYPISDLIPLINRAADLIDQLQDFRCEKIQQLAQYEIVEIINSEKINKQAALIQALEEQIARWSNK
jgi:hypothetical protein